MRATGKTFRNILKATLALSEGEDTAIVCLNYTEASRTIQSILRILETQGLIEHPHLHYTKYSITFMGTRLITVSLHDRNSPVFRGSNYTIIEDY